ncbi:MAG: hypothetical protein SGJ11_09160 [Phycisphaerae bacterium]|nr:hypothetical protein [Phycisphaerae bacterium]
MAGSDASLTLKQRVVERLARRYGCEACGHCALLRVVTAGVECRSTYRPHDAGERRSRHAAIGGAGERFEALLGPASQVALVEPAACCEFVCDYFDPFCCEIAWDDSCATWASQFCGFCPTVSCGQSTNDCCEFNFDLEPGCNDLECCVLVCSIDPFCCDHNWDPSCTFKALDICPVCEDAPRP